MPQKGTFTALKQRKPITTKFSDLITQAQDSDLKERRQKLAEDSAKRVGDIQKSQEKRAANKAFEDRYKIDNEAVLKTGFNSYDELMMPYASSIRDEMWETKQALSSDPENMKLKQKFSNLSNSVKTVKASNDAFSALLNKYATLQEKGGVSGVHEDKWLDLLQKYKNYQVIPTIDKETGMSTMVYQDENGENVAINLQDMIDGNIPIYAKEDANKLAGTIADRLGVRTKDNVTGRFVNTEISFDDVQEPAKIAVESYLQTDEQLADILNQANGSLKDGWDMSTPEGKKEREAAVKTASDWMIKQVKGSYNTKDTLKERAQPRVTTPKSTAGERKSRQQVVDRNLTIANAQNGDVEQLIGRPANSIDKNGKKITTIIKNAVITDDELVLELADETAVQRIDISRKSALNEIYNVATGIKVDSDMLDKVEDVTATKSGDVYEEAIRSLDFLSLDNLEGHEAEVEANIKENLAAFGITSKQTDILSANSLKLTAPNGKTLSVTTGKDGEAGEKEIAKIKEFIEANGDDLKEFRKKENKEATTPKKKTPLSS